jgi:hypothetical protein
METKFTKGKWRYQEPSHIWSLPYVNIGNKRNIFCEGHSYEEAEANAKLIAAAPELLETSINNLNLMKQILAYREMNGLTIGITFLKTAIKATEQAIKKATE